MTKEELVEKMLEAFDRDLIDAPHDYHADAIRRMENALDVAKEELLREPSGDELKAAFGEDFVVLPLTKAKIAFIFSGRRAQLDKVKTPEERVEVREWIHDTSKWVVLLDGWNCRDSATFDKADKNKAEIYRLGLIAKLKEEEGKS